MVAEFTQYKPLYDRVLGQRQICEPVVKLGVVTVRLFRIDINTDGGLEEILLSSA